jgi:hypothetical protein
MGLEPTIKIFTGFRFTIKSTYTILKFHFKNYRTFYTIIVQPLNQQGFYFYQYQTYN